MTDHYAKIESGPCGSVEIKEYSGGSKVGVIGGFGDEQEAKEYFESCDFDFPLKTGTENIE